MPRSTTVCAAAFVLASFTGSGPMLTVAEAMPAPGPQPTPMRPRYYFPRHVKRDIVTNSTALASPTSSSSTLSSSSSSQNLRESQSIDLPSYLESLLRNTPESSLTLSSSASSASSASASSSSVSSSSASSSSASSTTSDYVVGQSDIHQSSTSSSSSEPVVLSSSSFHAGVASDVATSTPSASPSAGKPFGGILPPFFESVFAPTGSLPSSAMVDSTGPRSSGVATSTLTSVASTVPASSAVSSFQGPFIISGTGTGGASQPTLQPTTPHGLLDGLFPSLQGPSEPAPTPEIGSTGLLPVNPISPTGSAMSTTGPRPFLPLPLPTGTGIMVGITAALDIGHSPLPTASGSASGAIPTSESAAGLLDLPGKLSSVLSELPGIVGPPSLGPTAPVPTASLVGVLHPALSSLLPDFPDLLSSLAAGVPLPTALSSIAANLESLLPTAPVPIALPTTLPSNLVPSGILPSLGAVLPSGILPSSVGLPTDLPLSVALPTGILPSSGVLPTGILPSGILPSSVGLPIVVLPSSVALPTGILPSSGVLPTGILASGILPSSVGLPIVVLPSSVALPTGILPSSGVLPIGILPSSVALPTGILPSSGVLPTGILPSSVALPIGILPSSAALLTGILPSSVVLPISILPSSVALPTGILPSSGVLPTGVLPSSVALPVGIPPSSVASPTGILPSSGVLPTGILSSSGVLPIGILPSSAALLSGILSSSVALPSGILPSSGVPLVSGGLSTGSLLPSAVISSSIAIPIPSETAGILSSIVSGSISLTPSASAGISPSGSAVPSGSVSLSVSPAPTLSATQSLSVPASERLSSTPLSGPPSSATATPPSSDTMPISDARTSSRIPTTSIESIKSPSAYISIPVIPTTASKPSLVISLSATATDSATSLVIGTSIVQEASSMPTPSASPTTAGIPSSLPRMIAPPGGVPSQVSQDTFMGQVCFKWPLNYPFVSANDGGMQIFHYLPKAIADGLNISQSEVQNLGLKPLDTTQYQGFITTLALFTIPSDLQNKLAAQLRNPADIFWRNKDSTVNDLTSLINTACPLAVGAAPGQNTSPNGAADPASTSNGYGGDGGAMGGDIGASRKVNSTSAIVASSAIVGALAYGAAMFFVARRYRNKRIAHQRSSSVPSTSRMTYGSIPGGAAAWMHGARNGRITPGSRGSQGSSASQGPSVRTQQISAPVMAENSLGWN